MNKKILGINLFGISWLLFSSISPIAVCFAVYALLIFFGAGPSLALAVILFNLLYIVLAACTLLTAILVILRRTPGRILLITIAIIDLAAVLFGYSSLLYLFKPSHHLIVAPSLLALGLILYLAASLYFFTRPAIKQVFKEARISGLASAGITFLGTLFMITSFFQFLQLVNFSTYRLQFAQMPQQLILLRYFVSMALRSAGLFCGLGLIFRKESFRKLTLWLCFATIATIYWKHPLSAVERTLSLLAAMLQSYGIADNASGIISGQGASWTALTIIYAGDIIFAFAVIYFLTRPSVKGNFNK